MCDPKRSCSVIEDDGLPSAFTTAHELGEACQPFNTHWCCRVRVHVGKDESNYAFMKDIWRLVLSQQDTCSTCHTTMWRPVRMCLGSCRTTTWCLRLSFRSTAPAPGPPAALPSSLNSWTAGMVSLHDPWPLCLSANSLMLCLKGPLILHIKASLQVLGSTTVYVKPVVALNRVQVMPVATSNVTCVGANWVCTLKLFKMKKIDGVDLEVSFWTLLLISAWGLQLEAAAA